MEIKQSELDEKLENHKIWLCDNTKGEMLDLSGTNLSGSNLRHADLSGANLSGADLSGAYLSGTNLSGADLSGAYLSGSNLRYANLRYADLRNADLSCANLRDADLRDANLRNVKGFVLLPIADYRGYSFAHASLENDCWFVKSGCRKFTIQKAKEHWGAKDYEGPKDIADQYLYAIEWLEKKIQNLGE